VTTTALIDSCVLIDVLRGGPWDRWSAMAIGSQTGVTAVNSVIIAEVAASYERIEDMQQALPEATFVRIPLTDGAAFLAGHAHRQYRRDGGTRERTLPDFLIGAHAAVAGMALVTRDPRRFRQHFPRLALVAPDTHFVNLAPALPR
jgi:predicted nucleic acid-binding protein